VYVCVGEERVRPRRARRLYVNEGKRKKEMKERMGTSVLHMQLGYKVGNVYLLLPTIA
jgi:hypothetical protein